MKTLITAAAITMIATTATAQSICGPREKILEVAKEKYNEDPVSAGVAVNGQLVELLLDREDGSWTIIVSRGDGVSCVATTGEAWMEVDAVPSGPSY